MAPMTDPTMLRGSPDANQPAVWPRKSATKAPAMPTSRAIIGPPGSFPGSTHWAIRPTRRPIIRVERIAMRWQTGGAEQPFRRPLLGNPDVLPGFLRRPGQRGSRATGRHGPYFLRDLRGGF